MKSNSNQTWRNLFYSYIMIYFLLFIWCFCYSLILHRVQKPFVERLKTEGGCCYTCEPMEYTGEDFWSNMKINRSWAIFFTYELGQCFCSPRLCVMRMCITHWQTLYCFLLRITLGSNILPPLKIGSFFFTPCTFSFSQFNPIIFNYTIQINCVISISLELKKKQPKDSLYRNTLVIT